jgi:hypothetical protein
MRSIFVPFAQGAGGNRIVLLHSTRFSPPRFHRAGKFCLAVGCVHVTRLETARPVCQKPARQIDGAAMRAFFVQIKCELGKSYEVASALADAEIASEIYSTAGSYDLLAKFYVEEDEVDIGHFVNERVQVIPFIKDTYTIVTFRAF